MLTDILGYQLTIYLKKNYRKRGKKSFDSFFNFL